MPTVPYHLGEQNEFSLSYATPDREAMHETAAAYDDETRTRFQTVELPKRPVYLIYTHTPVTDGPTEITIPDHPFVRVMIRAFAGVVDGRQTDGEDIRGSKSASLEDIPEVLSSRIDWKQSVTAVGGQLLSNLILTHALPNANHRTSLSMLLVYLQSVGVDIDPDTLPEDDVDTFIQESKRLLTIRRNQTKFRILSEHGCTHVERKGGIQIPLADYDLSVSDPYTHYARRHEQHATCFVESLVDDDWKETEDPGLRTFLDRL